jgi:hypothetical protein
MASPLTVLLRKPYYGILSPGVQGAVNINPPIDVNRERLVCFASRAQDVQFTVTRPDVVIVANKATMPVLWTFVVVPIDQVIGPTNTAWSAVINQAKAWLAQRLGRLR